MGYHETRFHNFGTDLTKTDRGLRFRGRRMQIGWKDDFPTLGRGKCSSVYLEENPRNMNWVTYNAANDGTSARGPGLLTEAEKGTLGPEYQILRQFLA